MHMSAPLPQGVAISAAVTAAFAEILSPEALGFVAKLHRKFESRRQELLAARAARQKEFDQGKLPDFLPQTKSIRESDWVVAPQPKDMLDRRVEITGPTDRKMVINALNSGANMFMADFEDSSTPTWDNQLQGQINMRDAVNRSISFTSPNGKQYRLADKTATLLVRPRGWHLGEKHVVVDGQPMSGALFDFGLYFFHNAKARIKQRSGVYLYLPKMESHLEARLWNDAFVFAQKELGVPQGTVKATVLIETILAAFEMEEILYELREHSAGLNCGRWDYIFSCIKKFRNQKDFILADRHLVTMVSPFMRSYSLLLDQDLPQAWCLRDGRHGRADSDQERSRRERGRAGESARRQGSRGQRRPRRNLGCAPRTGSDREGSLRQGHEDTEPDPQEARRRQCQRQ